MGRNNSEGFRKLYQYKTQLRHRNEHRKFLFRFPRYSNQIHYQKRKSSSEIRLKVILNSKIFLENAKLPSDIEFFYIQFLSFLENFQTFQNLENSKDIVELLRNVKEKELNNNFQKIDFIGIEEKSKSILLTIVKEIDLPHKYYYNVK